MLQNIHCLLYFSFDKYLKIATRLVGISICLLALSATALLAQDDRMTEADILKEDKYIEAFTPILYATGSKEKMIENLKKVLENDPMNDAAQYSLAKLYYEENDLSHALDYAQRAFNIDENNQWYAILLADIYELREEYSQAADLYKKLHNSHPDDKDYAVNYAYFLLLSDNAQNALKLIEKTEEKQGYSSDLSLKKIQILEALNMQDDIELEWEKLISGEPENMNWRLNLAQHYLQLEKYDSVKNALNDILILDPENVRAQLALSDLSQETAAYGTQSQTELSTLIRDPSKSLDLKINALLPEMMNLHPDSIEKNQVLISLAEEIKEQHPQNAKSWSLLGDFYFNTGNTGKATDAYEMACNLTKTVYPVWQQYLHCLIYIADFSTLEQKADEALMYFPNKAENYYFLAYANAHMENYDDALSDLREAEFIAGRNYGLHQNIAAMQAYIIAVTQPASSVLQDAIKSFATAEEVSPEALLWLLKAYEKREEKPDNSFLTIIEKSPEMDPTMDKYFVMAVFNSLREDVDKAIENALKSYYLNGYTRPMTSVLLGDLSVMKEDEKTAEQWYSNAKNQGVVESVINPKLKQIGL